MKFRKIAAVFAFFVTLVYTVTFCFEKKIVSQAVSFEVEDANFTNLIVFVGFNGEVDFVDYEYKENLTVKQITENNYTAADFSVKDYYYKVSNQKIKMQSLYLFSESGGAIELTNSRAYYSAKDDDNEVGYDSKTKAQRMLELKQDWSNAINSAIANDCKITNVSGDSEFDFSELDKNNDGLIDSLTIIYNYSTDYSIENAGVLWNYQDYYNGVEISAGGKTITSGNYVQLTANYGELYKDSGGVCFSNLQTMIHEMGHVFGLKDLYKKDLSSPVYYMSAMAKAISPIPQFISAKEREVLGWLEEDNIQKIGSEGTFTIKAISDFDEDNVVCYKLNVSSLNKTLYLEYRDFDGVNNKYDSKIKNFTKFSGENYENQNNLKSGLVCYLMNNGVKFPNNYSNTTSNYIVFGGGTTKNDSALGVGEDYDITTGLNVEVLDINNGELTFKVSGEDIEHIHTIIHFPAKSATCKDVGNDEYWKCSECEKCFDDEDLIYEKDISEFIISKKPHNEQSVSEVSATCKSEGVTAGEKCIVCGEIFSGCEPISKLSHSPSDWIIDKESTTTELGEKHKECLSCGEILETASIDFKQEEIKTDDTPAIDNNKPNTKTDEDSGDKSEPENVYEQDEKQDNNSKNIALIIGGSAAVLCLAAASFVIYRIRRKKK